MLNIKVKSKNIRFTIPIPYAILHIGISIISSRFLHHQVNKWTKENFERKKLDFSFPPIDKKTIKPIVKELKNHNGIVLVDIKAKDGTEVKVRL